MGTETRRNPINGDSVILSPDRGTRPGAWNNGGPVSPSDCPFCPGNEEETPPEITPSGNGDWSNRVVPNKYPAVGPFTGTPAHEVIIETREHDIAFEAMDIHRLTSTVELWKQRALAHESAPGRRYVSVFRNDGRSAGQSNPHPHSQLIALDHIPPRIAKELDGYTSSKTCQMCAILARGAADLLIDSSGPLQLFSPGAARLPYEMWIAGRPHASRWTSVDPIHLGRLLGSAIRRLRSIHPGAPFNLGLITAPITAGAERFHWYAEVIPRLTNIAGFELNTGAWINIEAPERASARLREADVAAL